MNNARRVNPAPALYAAAVAVLAYGVTVGLTSSWGRELALTDIPKVTGLVAIVSASVALAIASSNFKSALSIVAIGCTVIAIDVAVATGVSAMNFPSITSDNSSIGTLTIYGVVSCVFIVIAGLTGTVGIALCREHFGNVRSYLILLSVIALNVIVLVFSSAIRGIHPDVDIEFTAGQIQSIPINNGMLFGVGYDISDAALFLCGTTAILTFISVIILTGIIILKRRYNNATSNRIIISMTAITIIASIVTVLFAGVSIFIAIADFNAYHYSSSGRDLDVASALVAGIVALLGCTVVTGLAGAVAWWFQSLRGRRQD